VKVPSLGRPACATVEKAMDFTLGMQLVRLVIARLALFVPLHHTLWQRFPAWYHVAFIRSPAVFTLLGAMRRIPR